MLSPLKEKVQLLKIDHFHWYTPVQKIATLFKEHGHEVRIVGGAVRDIILCKQPKDVDLCTTANPDEMLAILEISGTAHRKTGIQHGTVTIYKKGHGFEMTSLRRDEFELGEKVCKYGKSFEEDANRRDLTINAMSLDIKGRLYDYYDGQEHLAEGWLRFVESAEVRIEEDPLRMLRYFRFASCSEEILRVECGDDYKKVFRDKKDLLANVAGERLWKEMEKVLSSPRCAEALDAMEECDLLSAMSLPKINTEPYVALLDNSDTAPGITCDSKAAVVLGLIFKGKPDLLQDLVDRWRVSNKVKEDSFSAAFISRDPCLSELKKKLYAEAPAKFEEQKTVFLQTFMSDKKCGLSKEDMGDLEKFSRPIFPFSKDHFGAVPEFKSKQKDAMDTLKAEWIKSVFTLPIKEMIEMVREMANQK